MKNRSSNFYKNFFDLNIENQKQNLISGISGSYSTSRSKADQKQITSRSQGEHSTHEHSYYGFPKIRYHSVTQNINNSPRSTEDIS